MRSWWSLALVAVLVAGCSDSGSPTASTDPALEVDFGEVEATATTGVIRGIVIDAAIRPLANVNVSLNDGKATATNTDGAFVFANLEPGTYFVTAHKLGYRQIQTSAEVVAGEDEPPIVKVLMEADPVTTPYVETFSFTGFLSFGAAVGLTSVGTTVYGPVANALGDRSIWTLEFTAVPAWAQGELVWEHTQAAGGELIWEMTPGGSNSPTGYRETTSSPALAYWNTTVLVERNETVLENGIAYRFFGGPHPAAKPDCTIPGVINPCYFGYGLTVQQRADAYIHNFYNFAPPEGWRFTVDGEPRPPE